MDQERKISKIGEIGVRVLDVGAKGTRSEQWHVLELVDGGKETQRQDGTLNSQGSVLREPDVRVVPRTMKSGTRL